MSDPNSTLWPTMPPASGVVQQLSGIGQIANKVAQSPSYQALASQSQPQTGSSGSPVLDKLMAGISSFDKTFLQASPAARLAEPIVNAIIPGASEKTKKDIASFEGLRQANPIASKIGQVGGFIGSIAQPSPPVDSLPSVATSAAATMLPYSAVAGADAYNQTGDVGEAIKKAAAAEALGVAGGTALGGAGLIFGKLAKSAHPILNEIDAASYGLTGSDVAKPGMQFAKKMGLNPTGYQATHGESQLDKIMTLLRTEGGRGKPGIEKATDWINNQYDSVNKIFQDSGAQLADKIPDILASPIVQTMKGKFAPQEVDTTIGSLVAEADKRIAAGPKGWSDARGFLNKQMQRGIEIGKKAEGANLDEITKKANMGEMLQDSASVVKAHMNELTGNVLNEAKVQGLDAPDLESLDQIYSAYPSLEKNLSRRMGKPMASMGGGSETTAGLGTLAGIAGMVGGPGAAGMAKAAEATAIAPLLKRGVGAATNQVMGRSAEWIDKILQALPKGQINPALATRAIGASQLGGGPGLMDLLKMGVIPPIQGNPPNVAQVAIPGQTQDQGIPAGAQQIPNAPVQPPAPTPVDQMNKANDNFVNPKPTQSEKPAFSNNAIESRMQQLYNNYMRTHGSAFYTYDSFKNEVMQGTGGLDPNNMSSFKVMYSDPDKATKMFNDYKALSRLPMDEAKDTFTANALSYYTHNILSGRALGRLAPQQTKDEEMANTTLVDTLHNLIPKSTTADINKQLHEIAFSGKNPQAMKQAVINMITDQGQVDIQGLHDLGLWRNMGGSENATQ